MGTTAKDAEGQRILREQFTHFSGVCAGDCPLYAALAAKIAEDDDDRILSLSSGGREGHPPPNLLFAAIHYLILKEVGDQVHPLRDYYPTVGGTELPEKAYPVFRDFCLTHADEIHQLVRTRLVQTNEVGRCGNLLLAFHFARSASENRRPLHLIEVGASSGLNLCFDQYHYDFSNGRQIGPIDSPARIHTEVRGDIEPPIPDSLPPVAARIGIDLAPVDVAGEDAMRWLEALIWPDKAERLTLFRAARDIARRQQPRPAILCGDALDLLPEVFAAVSCEALPCIFHCYATYQMDKSWHERFSALLADFGRQRDFVHLSQEWCFEDPRPMLLCEAYMSGEPEPKRTSLAEVHHHGRWVRWLAQ